MSVKNCETARFTKIIKQALDEQECSQWWLARKCGLTSAAMNRIVQGKANPNVFTIYSILNAIGVDFTDFALSLVGGDER